MSSGTMRHVRRSLKSFGFAFDGLGYLLRTQCNFWIHLVLAGLALAIGVLLRLGAAELAILSLAIGLVLVVEAANSALEVLVDLASPEYHPLAKTTKDVAAAAVLFAAATAVVVGVALFVPRLLTLSH